MLTNRLCGQAQANPCAYLAYRAQFGIGKPFSCGAHAEETDEAEVARLHYRRLLPLLAVASRCSAVGSVRSSYLGVS